MLFNDGTVFTYGYNPDFPSNDRNYGQTAPVDINTGSPVTKIVASEYGFVALKSNGTVKWWGSYTTVINDQTTATNGLVFFYNQTTITNIVDIYASNAVCFARDVNGKIFAWGYSNNVYLGGNNHDIFTNNYPSPQNTVKNYIQTGILSVYVTNSYVHFVKNDNTFMIVEIYGGDAGSLKYIQYTIPTGYTVHDILLITPNPVSGIAGSFKTHVRTCIPIITDGTKLFLWDLLYSTNNVIELCDINTTIVKKGMTKGYTTQNMNNPVHVFACLLSNSTFIWIDYSPIYFDDGYSITTEKRPIRVTDISNVTDFTIDGIIIQNGNVFDIKTNTPTQKTSNTLNSVIDSLENNVVQLFYTTTTIGALLSNRSFTYLPISGTTNPYTLSTDLRNQMTSGVTNVYDTADGYMLIKDTSFVWIGSSTTKIFGFENYTKTAGSSPNIGTLPADKNLFLLSTSKNVMPIELEKYTTSLSSLSVANNILQINNGDPNRMAHYGRTYKLYDITEPTNPVVISTFTASYEIMTFTFTNIPNTFYGAYTLSIVDTTNTPATMTVIDAFYSNITNPNAAIFTYSYTPIHLIRNKTFDFTLYSTSIFSLGTYSLKDASMQILSTITLSTATDTIIFSEVDTTLLILGMNSLYVYYDTTKLNRFGMVVNATCFLEGTKILTMDIRKNKTRYIPIEKLKPGMLVKTLSSGFIPIKHIGYSTLYNPGLSTYVKDQLFIYKKTVYPELIEDLVLTGTHSILVKTITDTDRKNIIDTLGGICVTENRYRLPAFNDSNAVRYERQGEFRIWNLALENKSYHGNYGIYANGLLVETTSCRYITELSGMKLIENK
jgi:hypothetical protein